MPTRNASRLLFLALILALAFAALAAAADNPPGYSYARIVRLSFVAGDVQIVRTDKSNKWEPAVMNMPVEQGFAVGTNSGRAEIELEHGSTIWLAENSVLQFTELALSNGGRISRMTLSEGTATFQTSLSAGDAFEVSTPTFRTTPAKNSEFRIDMLGDRAAVSVFNGKVSVSEASGTQDVPRGQTLALHGKSSSETALRRSPSTDEFDHWVSSRSSTKAGGESQTALYAGDAPFTYGMADLANYGSWNYFPGYGLGWQPWGMSAGWAPFMAGQWMFYPSLGWSWVSAEPWGWVPYHFGGWNYSPTSGWMWMPGNYGAWTAAPVQWMSVGNRIGWVPRNTLRSASTPTPVIVSTKNLGKEGKNTVYAATEVSGRIEALAVEPAPNGKPGIAGAANSARAIVPTAGSLGSLRAGLTLNAASKVNLNNAERNATSLRTALPTRDFAPVNAAVAAPKMPGHPPARGDFASPQLGDYSPAGSARAVATVSSQPVATSAPSSHATSGGSSGKPH